jgi:putative FmdB family regulatory protein
MPIYDYTCSNCRKVTEVIHGINDPGPKFCPECGAEGTMTKKFVAPTIHFKGSGWAKKDRSTARSSKAKDDTAPTAGDSKKSTDGSGRDSASDSGSTGSTGSSGTDSKKTDSGTSRDSGDSKGTSTSSSGSSSGSSSSSSD